MRPNSTYDDYEVEEIKDQITEAIMVAEPTNKLDDYQSSKQAENNSQSKLLPKILRTTIFHFVLLQPDITLNLIYPPVDRETRWRITDTDRKNVH